MISMHRVIVIDPWYQSHPSLGVHEVYMADTLESNYIVLSLPPIWNVTQFEDHHQDGHTIFRVDEEARLKEFNLRDTWLHRNEGRVYIGKGIILWHNGTGDIIDCKLDINVVRDKIQFNVGDLLG